jgi:hypothetical protein
MIRNAALATIIALMSAAAALPAKAQGYDMQDAPDYGVARQDRDWDRGEGWRERGPSWGDRLLPPRMIIGSLYRRGFRDVDIKRVRGGNYIVEARNREGSRVVIVVDGQTSEITGLRVVDWRRDWRFGDGGWNRPAPWSGPHW